MSDIQKLKDLMDRYHALKKPRIGYDDGGVVSQDSLAAYMPSKEEEEASGFPPGPQRATYIANKKMQAAQATKGYSDGGVTASTLGGIPWNPLAAAQISAGVNNAPVPKKLPTKEYERGKYPEVADAIAAGQAETRAKLGPPPGEDAVPQNNAPVTPEAFDAAIKKLSMQPGGGGAMCGGGIVRNYDAGGNVNPLSEAELAAALGQNSSQQSGSAPIVPTQDASPSPDNSNVQNLINKDSTEASSKPSELEQIEEDIKKSKAEPAAAVEAKETPDEDSDDEDKDEEVSKPTVSSNTQGLLADDKVAPEDSKSAVASMLSDLSAAKGSSTSTPDPYGDKNSLASLQSAQDHDKTIGGLVGLLSGNPAMQQQYMQHGQVAKIQAQREAQDQNTKSAMQQYQLADEKEKNDPNSAASQLARSSIVNAAKQVGWTLPPGINTMSASSVEKSFGNIDRLINAQSNNQTKQIIAQTRLAGVQNTQDTKATAAQDNSLRTTQQLLESARGNPAAAQAEKDLYSAQKANSLANLYGDPNNLSLPQVKLLAAEVGKIAAGGTSTQAELEGITPNTLVGKMSQYTSNLINKPTAANAAAFVKQYQDYTNALSKDAEKVIQDKYGRVIETRKKQLGPDNYQALQEQYINRFKTPTQQVSKTQTAPHGGAYPPGSTVSVKGKNYTVGADGDSLMPQPLTPQ